MADMSTLEQYDSLSETRNKLRFMSEHAGEWAGIPLPINGEELVVDPSYRFAGAFKREDLDEPSPFKIRNSFWSTRKRSTIYVIEQDGKIDWAFISGYHGLDYHLRTLGCSAAWGIEQEHTALQLLATLVKHHTFKHYLLTGSFLETSRRSGITYMFRKLRPTMAIAHRGDSMRILCGLCMHPIAYYADSWAGAMCPTDDVIAHLMLMRADEHMFWKRCNQHPTYRPEAGI